MRNVGTSTRCAGRSLSSENGSSAGATPRTKRPPGTSTDVPARPRRPGGRGVPAPRSGGGAGARRGRPAARLERLQHRLVVLVLVADHHGDVERVVRVTPRVEPVQDPAAHFPAERPRLHRRQQRESVAARPRLAECVVERLDGGRQQARPAGVPVAQQPEVLLLTDVGEVPDQGTHQRIVLPRQLGLVVVGEQQGAVAGGGELPGQAVAQVAHRTPSGTSMVRSSAPAGPLRAASASSASPGQPPRSTRAASASTSGRRTAGTTPTAASRQPRAAARRPASARPLRAARSQAPATGALAAAARSAATGSSSRLAVTAARAGHHGSGAASRYRISRNPRSRTGGNSVVRW